MAALADSLFFFGQFVSRPHVHLLDHNILRHQSASTIDDVFDVYALSAKIFATFLKLPSLFLRIYNITAVLFYSSAKFFEIALMRLPIFDRVF
jgi:hypothetical protein